MKEIKKLIWVPTAKDPNSTYGRGKGRPPQYVLHKGKIIRGLSWHKKSGRFYSTFKCVVTGYRVYFGYTLNEAVKAYRGWRRQQCKAEAEAEASKP